ncbi:MAG: PKD domain-containing protein [Cyclobacteriaceae bacterium]
MNIRISILTMLVVLSVAVANAQITDFVSQTTLCLNEELDLSSLESQLQSYYVDYCLGEFDNPPLDTQLALFSDNFRIHGSDLVYDTVNDSYHMFMVDNSRENLKRIDFGDSLTQTYEEQLVTFSSGSLVEPSEIKIVKDNDGNWYGFIASTATGTGVTRVDFGSSLTSDNLPLTNLGTYGEENAVIRSVSVWKEGTEQYLIGLLENNDRFLIADYGNSFLNVPSDTLLTSAIPEINDPYGFDLVKSGDDIIAFAVGFASRNVVRVNFGTAIFSDFVFENEYDDTVFPTITSGLSRINVQESFGEYYASVTHFNNHATFFVDLKGLDNAIQPEELGYSITQFNDVSGGYYNGNYIFYGSARRRMGIIAFTSDCSATEAVQQNPVLPVSYNAPGEYILGLQGITIDGDLISTRDTVEVLNSVAPDIDFMIDDNVCVDATNTFTSVNTSGDIDSYSWDFDGDGFEDSTDPNPAFSFDTPGNYDVKLTVSNAAGCSNEVTKSLTIYPAPQQPTDFSVTSAGPFCSNSLLSFAYNPAPELDGIVSFLWDFNGQATSSEPNPDFSFDSPGSKTVGLTISIPGCTTAVYNEVVEILTGPAADFDFSNNCFGEPIQFQNLSTGDGVLGFQWDFGDGLGNSTDENPQYEYLSGGTFTVQLTVINESGCITVYSEEIVVNDQPLAEINAGDAIENLPVSFQGTDKTLDGDNINQWAWEFGELGSSDSQDTVFIFPVPGEYLISLTVTTVNGCVDTIEQALIVEESAVATPSFEFDDPYCRDEQFTIVNTSVNASS